eukprot:TRINITY_DN1225_c0_g1_i1.p1 TRINITY_DN1225_c0_g1~~TRINITY_DN1225_c0_g1_i1.p1  ORF type:complete len:594 (+),score=46.90 TRINITY_DN1225_c0_g1_i1:51-1784(+)
MATCLSPLKRRFRRWFRQCLGPPPVLDGDSNQPSGSALSSGRSKDEPLSGIGASTDSDSDNPVVQPEVIANLNQPEEGDKDSANTSTLPSNPLSRPKAEAGFQPSISRESSLNVSPQSARSPQRQSLKSLADFKTGTHSLVLPFAAVSAEADLSVCGLGTYAQGLVFDVGVVRFQNGRGSSRIHKELAATSESFCIPGDSVAELFAGGVSGADGDVELHAYGLELTELTGISEDDLQASKLTKVVSNKTSQQHIVYLADEVITAESIVIPGHLTVEKGVLQGQGLSAVGNSAAGFTIKPTTEGRIRLSASFLKLVYLEDGSFVEYGATDGGFNLDIRDRGEKLESSKSYRERSGKGGLQLEGLRLEYGDFARFIGEHRKEWHASGTPHVGPNEQADKTIEESERIFIEYTSQSLLKEGQARLETSKEEPAMQAAFSNPKGQGQTRAHEQKEVIRSGEVHDDFGDLSFWVQNFGAIPCAILEALEDTRKDVDLSTMMIPIVARIQGQEDSAILAKSEAFMRIKKIKYRTRVKVAPTRLFMWGLVEAKDILEVKGELVRSNVVRPYALLLSSNIWSDTI